MTEARSAKARYSAEELLFRRRPNALETGVVNRVAAEDAGWLHLGAEVRSVSPRARFTWSSGDHEAVFVILAGTVDAEVGAEQFRALGGRATVFAGMPSALFVPPGKTVTLTGAGDLRAEFAFAWAKAERAYPVRCIRPEDVKIELRGGHSNSRQINQIVPPGFPCSRLVCVEVFTPAGNWSSYPPHKHDEHRAGAEGQLVEGDLEEFYCYKFREPSGFALQRVYTADGSTDATVTARDGDIVLVPFGYHPVSAAYGYDCYYLNFLAGSAQTLAATDDPAHAWVKETWTGLDPRVPMVTHTQR